MSHQHYVPAHGTRGWGWGLLPGLFLQLFLFILRLFLVAYSTDDLLILKTLCQSVFLLLWQNSRQNHLKGRWVISTPGFRPGKPGSSCVRGRLMLYLQWGSWKQQKLVLSSTNGSFFFSSRLEPAKWSSYIYGSSSLSECSLEIPPHTCSVKLMIKIKHT